MSSIFRDFKEALLRSHLLAVSLRVDRHLPLFPRDKYDRAPERQRLRVISEPTRASDADDYRVFP